MISVRMLSALSIVTISNQLIVESKILRLKQCDKFDADFSIVFKKSKLAITPLTSESNVRIEVCIRNCIILNPCQSFNYKTTGGVCELLSATKSATVNTIYDEEWTHYETDQAKKETGEICESKSPCPFDECEDTCFEPGYKCTCLTKEYTGENCDIYKGLGDSSSNNATSCEKLTATMPHLRQGCYWITQNGIVDQTLCQGLKRKDVQYEDLLVRNTLIKTMSLLSKSWELSFDLKPYCGSIDYQSIFHAGFGTDWPRLPGLWFNPISNDSPTKLYLHFSYYYNGISLSFNRPYPLPLHVYTKIRITRDDTSNLLSMFINGTLEFEKNLLQTSEYTNVKVYAGDPWHKPAIASMKNLKFDNL